MFTKKRIVGICSINGEDEMSIKEDIRWGDVWRECDPLDFLREHYGDLTRGELAKEAHGLYEQ